LLFLQYRCASKRLQLAKSERLFALFSSAAADAALAILVQPALIVAVAAPYLAENPHSVIVSSSQKSLDLQILLLHLEQKVRPTAH